MLKGRKNCRLFISSSHYTTTMHSYMKNSRVLLRILLSISFLILTLDPSKAQLKTDKPKQMLGMYVHMHWSFNHPYAARSWTLADWRGYLKSINMLGYNTVVIWPVIETMPDPLTYSDKAHLEKMSSVVKIAKNDLGMRVYFVLTPNVAANNGEASKYTLEDRPYNFCSVLINPKKSEEILKMMERRKKLCGYFKQADGFFLIDGDPGGWPDCKNDEFVNIFSQHRKMLNSLRSGMELYIWSHQGWETTGKIYSGNDSRTSATDLAKLLTMLSKKEFEPWGVVGSRYENDIAQIAGISGVADKVVTFKYGAIEREPSFPFTNYNDGVAYRGGKDIGVLGILGNAQQHGVQLPNTFVFAQAAKGLRIERQDYVSFADKLISENGGKIVDAWEALMSEDPTRMNRQAEQLQNLLVQNLSMGSLGGLLFGDPHRFVEDLILQLKARASIYEFLLAAEKYPKNSNEFSASLKDFILWFEKWQRFHGFVGWPRSTRIPGLMEKLMGTLKNLDSPQLTAALEYKEIPGETIFEKDLNRHKYYENYTKHLLTALKETLRQIER